MSLEFGVILWKHTKENKQDYNEFHIEHKCQETCNALLVLFWRLFSCLQNA